MQERAAAPAPEAQRQVPQGSAEALGVLVALSLVRELGPVVAALLFASRAGSCSFPLS